MKKGMIGARAALTALTGGVCAQDAAADPMNPQTVRTALLQVRSRM